MKRLQLDHLAFAKRQKIAYAYDRGTDGGWAIGILVSDDDAARIIAARNRAVADGNRRLDAKRRRQNGGAS